MIDTTAAPALDVASARWAARYPRRPRAACRPMVRRATHPAAGALTLVGTRCARSGAAVAFRPVGRSAAHSATLTALSPLLRCSLRETGCCSTRSRGQTLNTAIPRMLEVASALRGSLLRETATRGLSPDGAKCYAPGRRRPEERGRVLLRSRTHPPAPAALLGRGSRRREGRCARRALRQPARHTARPTAPRGALGQSPIG
jgi:hypothetical protein